MDLREQIGQRLVTGFPGTELTEDFRRMVREYKISNVILFRENITDCAQLKQLCGEIQALVRRETGHGAFITADQEGGLVTRLPGDAVNVPGAMAIAATGDPENAYRAGLLTGRELRALGVNFDLAPSVDVNSNPENPVIGARSYGDTPQEVSRYANRMIRGLLDGGVLCSAKHFPGHGDTDTDSHLALPCVDKSMEELERTELLPFREAVRAGVPAVMTTHILFPQLEPEHLPATMSRRIMTGLLREQMGFDGLIVSDCMEMRAIKDHFGTVNGVVAAMAAGVDLVFISHDTLLSGQAARAAEQAVAEGRLSAAEMQASVQRILALKEKWVDGMPEAASILMRHAGRTRRCCKRPSQRCTAPQAGGPHWGARRCASAARPTARRWWGMWMPARRTASATVWHGRCMAARRPCSRSRGGKRSRRW